MLTIKTVTAKNFISIGNVTQAVDFNTPDVTLVVGENIDLGGSDRNVRNGVGKSAIMNALSYGLFGSAVSNIKKDNLINRINGKGMLVTVEFEKDGVNYKIERGRKPATLKLWVGDDEFSASDNAQGDSRETQDEINRIIGMQHEMFKHIIAMNTYTEPFLSMKAADQRAIIEQLLGITILSEKADSLREKIRSTKEDITREEYRISGITDANKKIQEQIESLKRRQELWKKKHQEDIEAIGLEIEKYNDIDIEAEIQLHKDHQVHKEAINTVNNLTTELNSVRRSIVAEEKMVIKLAEEIEALKNHTCHACGQEFHDENHEETLKKKEEELDSLVTSIEKSEQLIVTLESTITEYTPKNVPSETVYTTQEEAFNHRGRLEKLEADLIKAANEVDPYHEQVIEMESTGIQEVSYDNLNELTSFREHQEFLLKLLTNKDSFIRKKIIDQNLNTLNSRLAHYLVKTGLPHLVTFNNDLSVSISEMGKDCDFDNLSRGERNRLIISLGWAFRDVWESLYQPINLLFVDELLDYGMDPSGVNDSLSVLQSMARDRGKSVWLVSHKEELFVKVNRILKVTKESGFTSYAPDIDVT